ncbi:MAG: efflux RND transporter periplasmic adaptor subunit [Clostridia bacterium]|nr:efflux RND transporter periplasmic adaptor subunit [Clostridia bacterium]
MLISFTAITVTILYLIPQLISSSLTRVSVVNVKLSDMKTTVVCSGTIESKYQRSVYYSFPLMAGKVIASIGQQVKAGETLVEIDKEDTIQTFNSSTSAGSSTQSQSEILSQAHDSLSADEYSALANSYGLSTSASTPSSSSSGSVSSDNVPDSISAPISGTVTQLNATEGSYTDPDGPVAVITDLKNLQVKAQVDEILLTSIKVGQKAVITGDGFTSSYIGVVTKIYPTARQIVTTSGTRTVVDILLSIQNTGNDLKPGLSADVSIVTADIQDSMTVPYEAIEEDDSNREYVFVYRNGHAFKTFITTGTEYANTVAVKTGLKPGDRVITNPPSDLHSGQVVRPGV